METISLLTTSEFKCKLLKIWVAIFFSFRISWSFSTGHMDWLGYGIFCAVFYTFQKCVSMFFKQVLEWSLPSGCTKCLDMPCIYVRVEQWNESNVMYLEWLMNSLHFATLLCLHKYFEHAFLCEATIRRYMRGHSAAHIRTTKCYQNDCELANSITFAFIHIKNVDANNFFAFEKSSQAYLLLEV